MVMSASNEVPIAIIIGDSAAKLLPSTVKIRGYNTERGESWMWWRTDPGAGTGAPSDDTKAAQPGGVAVRADPVGLERAAAVGRLGAGVDELADERDEVWLRRGGRGVGAAGRGVVRDVWDGRAVGVVPADGRGRGRSGGGQVAWPGHVSDPPPRWLGPRRQLRRPSDGSCARQGSSADAWSGPRLSPRWTNAGAPDGEWVGWDRACPCH